MVDFKKLVEESQKQEIEEEDFRKIPGVTRPEGYRFYNPNAFTTDPREIYEAKEKVLRQRAISEGTYRDFMREKPRQAVPILSLSINTK